MSIAPRKQHDRLSLSTAFASTRAETEQRCQTLAIEDYQLQSMPDCSPPKWHLAHSTWFFETFVLAPHVPGFRPFHERFGYLFNSYYDAIGDRWPRAQRGLLSRPTVAEVYDYRRAVDEQILALIDTVDEPALQLIASVIELGWNHEQQHQELLVTDVKHAFGMNPLRPIYSLDAGNPQGDDAPMQWQSFPAGLRKLGRAGGGFAFDNEGPPHDVYLRDFQIATRPVSHGEYLNFIEDGGYERPEFWLSDGWAAVRNDCWVAPLYWERGKEGWSIFTLQGMKPIAAHEPVCHISFYEADAYARWAGARLPTEFEWETAGISGRNFSRGDVWVWTASPYTAYPGFRPAAGAVGEYNGKFMCNQMVLRGGSLATPAGHTRPTYRNFFPPDARWQFSGLQLAKDGAA